MVNTKSKRSNSKLLLHKYTNTHLYTHSYSHTPKGVVLSTNTPVYRLLNILQYNHVN